MSCGSYKFCSDEYEVCYRKPDDDVPHGYEACYCQGDTTHCPLNGSDTYEEFGDGDYFDKGLEKEEGN